MSNENYSPDVISGRLRLNGKLPNVSTETIYNFIYTSPIAAQLGLRNLLPTKRLKRQERGKRRQRVVIPARISICQLSLKRDHQFSSKRDHLFLKFC